MLFLNEIALSVHSLYLDIPLSYRVRGPYCKLWPPFFPIDLWPKREARGHKSKGKTSVVIYSTDRENEVSKIFIISLYLGIEDAGRVGKGSRSNFNLAGRTVEYGPQNQPITARVLSKRYNKVRYRPAVR